MSYKKFVLGSLVLVAVIVTAFAVADAKKGDRPPAAPAQKAFLGVYLLFGKDRGPRLGTFLAAVPVEQYVDLLKFTDAIEAPVHE